MASIPRRSVLAALGTAITGGVAGCSDSDSGDSGYSCGTSTVESNSNSTVLRPTITRENERVLLEVWLEKPGVSETNINTVKIFNSEGRLEHEIPTQKSAFGGGSGDDDFVKYYHTIGLAPQHGHIRVEAQTVDGTVVDFREFVFSCNTDPYA